jgi:hypothetical protein
MKPRIHVDFHKRDQHGRVILGSGLKSHIQPMTLHTGMEAIDDATTRTVG